MIRALVNTEWKLIKKKSLELGAATFDYEAGLYETFRTLNYRPIFLEAHIKRLLSGVQKLGLIITYSKREISIMAEKVIKDFPEPEQRVRILAVPNNLILYSEALNFDSAIYRGVKTITVNTKRLRPELKTTDYAACLKAWKKARRAEAFEALLIDQKNNIYEGSRSNIFWVRAKKLFTRETDVLPGVTRQIIISQLSPRTKYGILSIKDLRGIDELFITNSGSGIVPVIEVEDQIVGLGMAGPVYRKLLDHYESLIKAESRRKISEFI